MDKTNLQDSLEQIDPIECAERALNKPFGEMNVREQWHVIAGMIDFNQTKRKIQKANKDTYFGMSWNDFKDLIKEHGFRILYSNVEKDEEIIAAKGGMILHAESYGNSINGGDIYFQMNVENVTDEDFVKLRSKIYNCGFGLTPEKIFYIEYDVREGLFNFLSKFEGYEILPKWEYPQHIWLASYEDEHRLGYDFDTYTKVEINKVKTNPELFDILQVWIEANQK